MEVIDPLSDFTGLSLFPKTLPNNHSNNTNQHDFLLNIELQNPNKYHNQAKQTLELLSLEKNDLNHENQNDHFGEAPRERRPGLGRKKAIFLINTRQPSVSSEPIKDADLSKDPKEFFAYFERREMAEKELRRLRGESVNEVIDFDLPIPERPRRPGLLGKTATYKHPYQSSTASQNRDTIMPSQETLEEGLLSPVIQTSQPDEKESHGELKERLTEPVSKPGSQISMLVDELLHGKDLYADEVSALVLERLQIESSITDEIPIPVFRDSRKDTKPRPVLSNVQNLPRMMTGKALAKDKQLTTRLSVSLASSPLPTSPFASISAFQKHIQRANLSDDRFAGLNMSPPRNSSFQEQVDEQSNHFGTGKDVMASSSSELKKVVPETDDDTVHNLVSSEMITDGKTLLYDKSGKDQLSRSEVSNNMSARTDTDFGLDVGNEFVKNIQVDDVVLSTQMDANVGSSSGLHTDFQTAGLNANDENLETMSPNAEPFINEDLTAKGTKSRVFSKKRTKSRGHKADYASPAAEVIPVHHTQNMDEPSEARLKNANNHEAPKKGHQRKEAKEPVEASQTQAERPHKKRKTKEFSRRNSLAAAGTHWVEGTRKSNRIKVKPLEFWKGERLLYARVHESLPTVIGLRYDSPEKGSKHHGFEKKRNLKVESYVHGGEYEELVKQRALY